MTFWWWEDAVQHAVDMTLWTMIRHKVSWTPGGWTVELADDAVMVGAA